MILTAHSSEGVIEFDSVTGNVTGVFPNRPGEISYLDMINRIDVEEYRYFYGKEIPDQVDMLDVAHVLIGGEYVGADASFRWDRKKINAV